MNTKFQLHDEDAQKIFNRIGGIDKTYRFKAPTKLPVSPTQGVKGVISALDQRRIHLIELVIKLSRYFADSKIIQTEETEEHHFSGLLMHMEQIGEWPGHDGTLRVQYHKGHKTTGLVDKIEYQIQFGLIEITADIIPQINKRVTRSIHHLSEELFEAFKLFYQLDIQSIYLEIPNKVHAIRQQMQYCLRYLSYFYNSINFTLDLPDDRHKPTEGMYISCDEKNTPDPNLSLTANLCHIPEKTMDDWIQKTHRLIQKKEKTENPRFFNVYDAIFHISDFARHLRRPPIEINNLKQFIASRNAKGEPNQAARLVRLLEEGSEHMPSQTVTTLVGNIYGKTDVYGNDFKSPNSGQLNQQLRTVGEALDHMANAPQQSEIENEVLGSINRRFAKMHADDMKFLIMPGDIHIPGEKESQLVHGITNVKFKRLIRYFEEQVYARERIKGVIDHTITFTDRDVAGIAKFFNFSDQEARKLIQLIRECFDAESRFQKKSFENAIPFFAKYSHRIFEFLWDYLKASILRRKDRVAFLNALQLLIDKMAYREKAIRILLSDVFRKPSVIHYSDRNAMMLSNLLIRKYNKELNLDIELTPEEVLLTRFGLDTKRIKSAALLIDANQENFLRKTLMIQEKIKKGLNGHTESKDKISLKYLFYLEREIITFFSLIGGATAPAIIRIAMTEYGNPDSDIYHLKESIHNIQLLLQRLRLVVRGYGRIGDEDDLYVLDALSRKLQIFKDFAPNTDNLIRQITEVIEESVQKIHARMSDADH